MKRFLSVIIALMLIISSVPFGYAAIYDGFVYTENADGTYTITGYRDFHTDYANIPSQINGVDVTAIGASAFQTKNNINTVRIPETVKTIGSLAFYGCKNLATVIMGDNVTSIGAKAFNSCTSLTGINLKNVQILGEYAFYGCTSLTELHMGNALKVIGQRAFHSCSALSLIKMCDSLLYIDDYAFTNCIALTDLKFPDKLGYIGNSAFKGCSALSGVTFGSGDLEISGYAFENCIALTQITIPDNVNTIGRYAFALRENNTTEFSHGITITCNLNSAALDYAKLYNCPVYISEIDRTVSAFGDVDGNGKVDTTDAKLVLRIAASISTLSSEDELFLYDMNNNGIIDTGDAQLLLKKAAGII